MKYTNLSLKERLVVVGGEIKIRLVVKPVLRDCLTQLKKIDKKSASVFWLQISVKIVSFKF
jgi:hypothetical protein